MASKEFPELWLVVEDALKKVSMNDTNQVSFERVYNAVYIMVINDESLKLYENLNSFFTSRLSNLQKDKLLSRDLKASDFLKNLLSIWNDELRHFQLVGDLMIYLDKVFCKLNRKLEIIDLCLEAYKNSILKPLKNKICSSFIEIVNDTRSKMNIEDSDLISLLTGLINMMETIAYEKDNFFIIDFEPIFLKNTKEYYQNALPWNSFDSMDLFDRIKQLMSFENLFMNQVLNNDTLNKVNNILDNVLVKDKINSILDDLIKHTIIENDSNLLNSIFQLTKSQQFHDDVVESIKLNISNNLMTIMINVNEKKKVIIANKFINDLLKRYDYYNGILSEIKSNYLPDDDKLIKNILNDSFSRYFQTNSQPNSVYLSLFLDFNSKYSSDKNSFYEILTRASKFFNLIPDKDEFVQIYRQQLSKRLLQKKTDFELEKLIIKQIKDVMGGAFFTFKLENMLKDVITSDSLAIAFNNHNSKSKKISDNEKQDSEWIFIPEILTMTAWPLQNFNNEFDKRLILPDILQNKLNEFEKMYKQKFTQRIINWSHNLGLIEIGFRFNESYHDLIMPLYCGITFLLFRDYDELTFEEIQAKTQLPENELIKQLMTLSLVPRFQILRKDTREKSILPTDKFSINYSFKSVQNPVKVQTISMTRAGDGRSQQEQQLSNNDEKMLEKERILVCNSAVVRVIKQERKLTYKDIFDRVKLMLSHFTLTDKIFYRSIHYLLDKEFVQADPYEPEVYHYLA